VHAQDFFVNESSNRETVEAVGEGFPQFDIVSSLAFVVETINTVDGGALVVSSQEEEVLRVLYLVSQEKANGLKTLLASVHVVTEEQVVGIRRETAILKQSKQVIVLTMNITANLDWRFKF